VFLWLSNTNVPEELREIVYVLGTFIGAISSYIQKDTALQPLGLPFTFTPQRDAHS
jgi:hypothetical protein